jgi:hypothetical protein
MRDKRKRLWLEVLDECLSRIQSGEATVELCQQEFPEYAEDLALMLSVADEVQKHLAPPEPSEVFKSTSGSRVVNRWRAMQKGTQRREERWTRRIWRAPRLSWQPAYVIVSAVLAIGLLATSAGVASASTNTLPGDALYGVKRGIEEVRLAFTLSATGDAALLEGFADLRLDETEALLAADRQDDALLALEGYEEMVSRLTDLAGQAPLTDVPGSLEHLQTSLESHIQVLQRVRTQVPEKAQEAIDHAIERSSHGQEVIEQVRQGESPSDQAPGQLKKTEDQPGEATEENDLGKGHEKTPGPKQKEKTPGPPPKKEK